MNYLEKKPIIINKAINKIAELKQYYSIVKDNPEKKTLADNLIKTLYRLKELINPDTKLIDDEQYVKNEFPILYYFDYDFTNEMTFYSQITSQEDIATLASDPAFIRLLASAPCKETLRDFINYVQEFFRESEYSFSLNNMFYESTAGIKSDVLDALFLTTEDWNKDHLRIRSEIERTDTIGERLGYLTMIEDEQLKTAIFTNHRVLKTLKEPKNGEDYWFFAQEAGKLPEYVNLKILQYLLSRKIFHFSYLNEMVRKYEVTNPRLTEYIKTLKLK